MATVVNGEECAVKDRGNGAGAGYDAQGSCVVGVVIVVIGVTIKVLEGFHHQVARSMTGMTAGRMMSRERKCPPVAETMETVGLWPIKEYIQRRKDTVAAQVAYLPIYEL